MIVDPQELNRITGKIIGCAIAVHRAVGPGLLESTYQACLAVQLRRQGLQLERQVPVPIVYEGLTLDQGYRLDMLVERSVVVELKAATRVEKVFLAQLRTYLWHSGCRVGLLLSFHVEVMVNGVHRVVNNFPEPSLHSAASARSADAVEEVESREGIRTPVDLPRRTR